MKTLHDGDEIAILPHMRAQPSEVLGIAKVTHAGELYIKLNDGRMFATTGGRGLNTIGYVAVVTDAHRAALNRKPQFRMVKARAKRHRNVSAVNQPQLMEESVCLPMPLNLVR
jgi:hypothetical protein